MSNQDENPLRSIVLPLLLCIAAWPVTFIVVVLIWRQVLFLQARHEVQAFIASHQAIVAERHEDPRVYSFGVAADPEDDSRLLISWDVADSQTYLMLDDDVGDWISLTRPPRFECNLRSGEELPNDFGAMAYGMGTMAEGLFRLKVTAAIATVVMLLCVAAFFVKARSQVPSGENAGA